MLERKGPSPPKAVPSLSRELLPAPLPEHLTLPYRGPLASCGRRIGYVRLEGLDPYDVFRGGVVGRVPAVTHRTGEVKVAGKPLQNRHCETP
ncbi:hypothetical protein GCM10009642_42250 [Nocardiopsis metallicus]|uniref:Uncharacterized protein n=1 Tax=Nocardiopsis metallicus TaxID=179819 RepID=A0A840WCD3_9ACTN|nr:hypothetical protein [Nocardiopsis metallicus]